MRQLLYTMFISNNRNNRTSSYLWRAKNLLKHPKVSKYYETDCRLPFLSLIVWISHLPFSSISLITVFLSFPFVSFLFVKIFRFFFFCMLPDEISLKLSSDEVLLSEGVLLSYQLQDSSTLPSV